MSKGLCSALDYLWNGSNKVSNTKNGIIFMAEADKTITRKIKEIEEKAMQEVINVKPQDIHFDFSEIETIVLRDDR